MKDGKASRAMEHLDDELILSAMDESDIRGKGTRIISTGKNKMKNKKIWMRWTAVAAAFVIMLTAGVFVGRLAVNANNTTIALDVNPSIEIEINGKEKVKEVRALNEDARIVIGDMDLEDVDLDVVLYALIGSMLDHGYLSTDQNSILVSIDSKDETRANALKEKLVGEINSMLGNKNIEASVITQNYDKKDNGGNASSAKLALISKIISAGLLDANGVPYTEEVLSKLNVNELKLILESKAIEVDGISSSGSASAGKYISVEDALAAALAKAGFEMTQIERLESEMDYDDDFGIMVYEIEFCAGEHRYEYEINAVNGEILEEKIKTKAEHDHDRDENVKAPENSLTREAALDIAYKHAGVSADTVRRPEIELELERGEYFYEIEFKSGGMEYEYLINATSGEIVHHEKEIDD